MIISIRDNGDGSVTVTRRTSRRTSTHEAILKAGSISMQPVPMGLDTEEREERITDPAAIAAAWKAVGR